jgi:hypothetical protein
MEVTRSINYIQITILRIVLTPKQGKMARVVLDWTVRELTEKANVVPNTVSTFEKGRGTQFNTAIALEQALLSSGKVRFEGYTGVCFEDY